MTKKILDVYGIGNAIVDLQLMVTEEQLKTLQVTKGEIRLVDVPTQLNLLRTFSNSAPVKSSGGSVANSMIALSQLGGKAGFGCLLGDDEFGVHYLQEMTELGITVNTGFIKDGMTGTCVILITPDAERTMNTSLGSSAEFSTKNISRENIESAEWLYIEGYLLSNPSPAQEAVEEAIAIAKRAGVKIAVTFSDGFVVDVFGEQLRKVVNQADLAFANLNEAKKFTGEQDEEKAFSILSKQIPNVIMTLSERGALVSFGGETHRLDAFPVRAIDDTGAGDMFAGAFLYGITQGYSALAAAKLACFLASRIVSQMGPRIQSDLWELPGIEMVKGI